MTGTGVVWDPVYLEHVTDEGHPDHPRRLKPLYRRLQDPLVNRRFTTIAPPAATDEEILLVHSPSYLNQVKATETCPSSALSADTLTCNRSFPVAVMAVGGTIEAIRRVVAGTLSHALVLARPPGHHAERTRAMGYCIFNNVAIGSMAARTAMGLARVMVVDWDLHHGNGTQHIFERDPSVFFLSSHQFPPPMVFAGLYPVDSDQYGELRDALEKLRLNDSSFFYEPETSAALGFGFRCGFLGLLHMEIVEERLEREFDLDLLVTAPSVRYRVLKTDGDVVEVDSPARLPEPGRIEAIEEPVITATILTGNDHVGPILKLCQDKRGIQKAIQYITTTRVMIQYDLPLAEILLDFYDRLKSASRGYASLDYEFSGHWVSPLVKLDVLVNGDPVDALSLIVHRETAYQRGKTLVEKMRKIIPRQMFDVAIQAAVGSRVIARESVKALRKNVTAKCYGGDITRKRKLLEKQKEGKKRMKRVGTVDIPQEAFLAVLRVDE